MSRLALGSLVSSLALHVAAIASLEEPTEKRAGSPRPSSRVDFEVAVSTPLEPEPETESTEPTEAVPPVAATPLPPPGRVDSEPNTEDEPAEALPVDLSGVTLTNAGGEGRASPTGNGRARRGALFPVAGKHRFSRREAHKPDQSPRAPSPPPAVFAATDLSERPAPPLLVDQLRKAYPEEARRRGISGNASLRVRIEADGRVKVTSRLSETFDGFGRACEKVLVGSVWTAPKDRSGRAVATEVRYTCHFVVE